MSSRRVSAGSEADTTDRFRLGNENDRSMIVPRRIFAISSPSTTLMRISRMMCTIGLFISVVGIDVRTV